MLVFTRKRLEQFRIGDDIIVTVTDVRGDRVKIGIDAPDNIEVHREEVYHERNKGIKKKGDTCEVQSDSQP